MRLSPQLFCVPPSLRSRLGCETPEAQNGKRTESSLCSRLTEEYIGLCPLFSSSVCAPGESNGESYSELHILNRLFSVNDYRVLGIGCEHCSAAASVRRERATEKAALLFLELHILNSC